MGEESKVRVNKTVPSPTLWIPAYAGMTVLVAGMTVRQVYGPITVIADLIRNPEGQGAGLTTRQHYNISPLP